MSDVRTPSRQRTARLLGGAAALAGLWCERRPAAHAHDTLVNGRLHTVVLLDVNLGELVALDARGLLDVTQRRRLHNVAHNEALDRLVLRDRLAGRDAADAVDVAAALLVAAVRATLDRHGSSRIKTPLYTGLNSRGSV